MKHCIVLFFLFLSTSQLFAHRADNKRKTRHGTEHFFRGKLYMHNRHNVLGDSLEGFNPLGNPNNVLTLWFNQTLDHFTPSDTRTWKQVSLLGAMEF